MDKLTNINSASLEGTIKGLGNVAGKDVIVLELSGETITGNSIDGSINSVAIATTAFVNNHPETMAAFIANLEANAQILKAEVQKQDDTRIRIIGIEGVELAITTPFAITGGASQATITQDEDAENTGLVEQPSQITKDVMAIGGTKQVIIGTTIANFTKAYAIKFLQDSVVAAITFDNEVTDPDTVYVGPTYSEGTVHEIGFTSITLTSGVALVYTLETP